MISRVAICAVMALAPWAVAFQSSGTAAKTSVTGAVSGVVVDERGIAVGRALVSLSGQTFALVTSETTDREGRFEFSNVPLGKFLLRAEKPAYLTSHYGAKRPGRMGIALTLTESGLRGLQIRLWKGGVVAGTIRDDLGRPVAGVTVAAFPVRGSWNDPTLTSLTNNGVMTGPRGEYRIFGLEPGHYVLSAMPPPTSAAMNLHDEHVDSILDLLKRGDFTQSVPMHPLSKVRQGSSVPIYYPGTAMASEATKISLASGAQHTGLDFGIFRVPTAVVTGTLSNPDGTPSAAATVLIRPAAEEHSTVPQAPFVTNIGTTGQFTFRDVPPGRYRVVAQSSGIGRADGQVAPRFAVQNLQVAGTDISDLRLMLGDGLSVKGRLTFAAYSKDKTAAPPPRARLTVLLRAQDGRIAADTAVRPDGTFSLAAPPDDSYQMEVRGLSPESGWFALAATVDGRDLLDDFVRLGPGEIEIEVMLSDAPNQLYGRLRTADGQGVSDVFVLAFTAEEALWGRSSRRVRAVRPDVNGHFVVTGLPPGRYFLGAVTDVDPVDWSEPSFFKDLAAASAAIEIKLGSSVRQDLRVASKYQH